MMLIINISNNNDDDDNDDYNNSINNDGLIHGLAILMPTRRAKVQRYAL
jgi:hypothetical protein